jgi:hypothetical protein
VAFNSYQNTSNNDTYRVSANPAGKYQISGGHAWFVAPSGTAGNAITFTQAMTLGADGNLALGTTTTSGSRLVVVHPNTAIGATTTNGVTVLRDVGGISANNAIEVHIRPASGKSGYLTFTEDTVADRWAVGVQNGSDALRFISGSVTGSERMRITSAGELLIGTTDSGLPGNLTVYHPTAATSVASLWNGATSGDNVLLTFFTDGGIGRGSISFNRAGGLTAYNTTSDYRAKDIIGPVVDSGAVIDSTPVYMGKMKGATQERPMFIAHETPAYAHTGEKDAVDADGKPVYQQMDASALVPVMWAEIQSLRARVAALEGQP